MPFKMRLLTSSSALAPWLVGFGVFVCTASSIAADNGVVLGRGNKPTVPSAPLIETPEVIERMRKSNAEIAAGFARIDFLLNEIGAARAKIKQVMDNHQELTLCIALQQAQNEANKISSLRVPLSPEQKQTLVGYQRAHADLSSDIRKAGIACPSSQTPR
jgi:hypothetical protein